MFKEHVRAFAPWQDVQGEKRPAGAKSFDWKLCHLVSRETLLIKQFAPHLVGLKRQGTFGIAERLSEFCFSEKGDVPMVDESASRTVFSARGLGPDLWQAGDFVA